MSNVKHYVSPEAAWPNTKIIPQEAAFRVWGLYTNPLVQFVMAPVLGCSWLLMTAGLLPEGGVPEWQCWLACILPIPLTVSLIPAMQVLTLSWVNVKFRPDAVCVGLQEYSRTVPITFQREEHEESFKEAKRELESGQKQPRIFRDAVQVVMRYHERRVVIASFPLEEIAKADALVLRLQFVNENLEQMLQNALIER